MLFTRRSEIYRKGSNKKNSWNAVGKCSLFGSHEIVKKKKIVWLLVNTKLLKA
jgi:hypothetical protein